MNITPDVARNALKDLCALSKMLGKETDLGCVKKLVQFIDQQEKQFPKVAVLLKPPQKVDPCPFLTPISAGD